MPNDILYLDIDDEIPSVIEKLRQHQAEDAVLVVPDGASLLQSIVNVKLLKRAAEKVKKRLALVTPDPIGRHVASQVNIPVFVSVKDRRTVETSRVKKPVVNESEELDLTPMPKTTPGGIAVHHYNETDKKAETDQGSEVPKPESPTGFSEHTLTPVSDDTNLIYQEQISSQEVFTNQTKKKTPLSNKKLFIIYLTLSIAGLIYLIVFYPRAVLELTVATEPFEANPIVTVDTSKQFITDNSKGTISGEHFEKTVEVQKEVETTGTKDAGTKSTGVVSLENRLGQAVKLATGTTIATSSINFKTTQEVTIPAATATVDATGSVVVTSGKVEVNVEAVSAGETGNIAKGAVLTVQGVGNTIQDKVNTTAKAAFTGGTTKQLRVVSDTDIEQAKSLALEEADNSAKNELIEGQKEKRFLDESSRSSIINEEISHKSGDEAEKVSAKISVKYESLAFNETALKNAIVEQVKLGIPSGKMIVLDETDEIVTDIESVDWSAGTMKLMSIVKTKVAPEIDQSELITKLKGKTLSSVESTLRSESGIQRASFTLRPSWLPIFPLRSDSIKVEYNQ